MLVGQDTASGMRIRPLWAYIAIRRARPTNSKIRLFRSTDMSLAEAAIFKYAFKLGMQIAIETLTDTN